MRHGPARIAVLLSFRNRTWSSTATRGLRLRRTHFAIWNFVIAGDVCMAGFQGRPMQLDPHISSLQSLAAHPTLRESASEVWAWVSDSTVWALTALENSLAGSSVMLVTVESASEVGFVHKQIMQH